MILNTSYTYYHIIVCICVCMCVWRGELSLLALSCTCSQKMFSVSSCAFPLGSLIFHKYVHPFIGSKFTASLMSMNCCLSSDQG